MTCNSICIASSIHIMWMVWATRDSIINGMLIFIKRWNVDKEQHFASLYKFECDLIQTACLCILMFNWYCNIYDLHSTTYHKTTDPFKSLPNSGGACKSNMFSCYHSIFDAHSVTYGKSIDQFLSLRNCGFAHKGHKVKTGRQMHSVNTDFDLYEYI